MKENIYQKEGIPVEQFRLIYAGQAIDENKKLTDYKVEAGHTLIMVSVLRGGWLYIDYIIRFHHSCICISKKLKV